MADETFWEAQNRKIAERNVRRLAALEEADPVEPVVVRSGACPTCGAKGDDPCLTASGKVKDEWHARRSD